MFPLTRSPRCRHAVDAVRRRVEADNAFKNGVAEVLAINAHVRVLAHP